MRVDSHRSGNCRFPSRALTLDFANKLLTPNMGIRKNPLMDIGGFFYGYRDVKSLILAGVFKHFVFKMPVD
jgi:hypothetical protein